MKTQSKLKLPGRIPLLKSSTIILLFLMVSISVDAQSTKAVKHQDGTSSIKSENKNQDEKRNIDPVSDFISENPNSDLVKYYKSSPDDIMAQKALRISIILAAQIRVPTLTDGEIIQLENELMFLMRSLKLSEKKSGEGKSPGITPEEFEHQQKIAPLLQAAPATHNSSNK